MSDAIIYLDPDSDLSLQAQIHQKMIEGISLGTFPPGRKLPSSRKLADQLGVARNTVVLVYQLLTDEGYLVSRERSGIYVNEAILDGRVGFEGKTTRKADTSSQWRQRIRVSHIAEPPYSPPSNWQQYPYPFIDGQFDRSLYPVKEWREASRLALGVREINDWAGETGDADDPLLIEQIRTRILPRRGIQARSEEILVTVGTQQGLYLLSQLLVDQTVSVAVEEPGYPDLRRMLAQRGAAMVYQPVDDEGMVVDGRLDTCNIVAVTPSHQTPTAVTMSNQRRQALLAKAALHDQIIIEDDFEFESNYLSQPHPAIYSMDTEGRVVYLSCLSKVLAPGLRLGFMVAPPELINEARKLRQLIVRHPPLNNQRTAALFLSLGHYDTFVMHMHRIFQERWTELRKALNFYMVEQFETTRAQGGTACWIKGPEGLDVNYLVKEAARRGILIEPVAHYYASANIDDSSFRMGVTSLPTEKIRAGVAALFELIQEINQGAEEGWKNILHHQQQGEQLADAVTGATLLCKTIYGDPCTIELHADGTMTGQAGTNAEDSDSGQWWVEGEYWCRQWQRWSYGEQAQYLTAIKNDTIHWYDKNKKLVETAVIKLPGPLDDRTRQRPNCDSELD